MPHGKKRVIEFVIKPDGSTNIDAIDFVGKSCKAATKPYEDVLGTVTSETVKPAMHATATAEIKSSVPRKI